MPTFSAVYGAYSVQGSYNQWFVKNITANGTPGWMPSARVIFDWGKERPVISGYSGHAFSIAHLNDRVIQNYQGMTVDNGSAGQLREGQVEINCWVSRSIAGEAYMARLREMRDMVEKIFLQNDWVILANLYAATAGTASSTARMMINAPEFQPPQADPINADIFRIRGVADYSWISRT